MFRRRTPAPAPATAPADRSATAPSADRLADAGWALPRGITAGHGGPPAAWTLVGTVGSPVCTPVDPAGLVVGEGWSLDWWIGGDDRWHLPTRESAVRQDVLADVPVVETRVRIPGGDAVHRAFGIRAPRQTGDEWVVAEVQNATPVPFGVALVIRPYVANGLGSINRITIEPVGGGSGRDEAHLVRVDGRPAVVLPRRPARVAVGNAEQGDVVEVVTSGEAGEDLVEATCPDGFATMALVYPLPHTAQLRAVLPVGEVDLDEAVAYPSVIPDADTVASGWEVHLRGPRLELPERRMHVGVQRARAQVLLAHNGEAVRRDGHRSPDLEPGATEVILGALDLLDRPADVGTVVARWQDRLADPRVEVDALALAAISHHWLVHRIDALRDWMLPEVAAAVERLDRADRKGRLTDPGARARAAVALQLGAQLLAASDQEGAAAAVGKLAGRVAVGAAPATASAADRLVALTQRIASGEGAAYDELLAEVVALSPTGVAAGPGPGGRTIGQDLAASAALATAGRTLLVTERTNELALLPVFPAGWYGGSVELHDAPTAFGRVSYAIRWHGTRPALLWELEPHDGVGPVTLTIPGLDPTWSTTDLRGDALLAEVAPPEDLDPFRLVPDHPDIDPDMRRPGDEPEPPAVPLPDGGTFS